LSVFETVVIDLDLSYTYYQKLKWFVYLSSILLIMRPLIEQLFNTTNGTINDSEKSYLSMMKYVGIGIISVGAIAYIMSYIIGDIQVNIYKTVSNPSWIQSLLGFDQEISGKRSINGFEVILDLSAMAASYFTETLAGFMLITSKDILFPEQIKGGTLPKDKHKKKLSDDAANVLQRMTDLIGMSDDDVVKTLVTKDAVYKEKNKLLGFDKNSFANFPDDLARFTTLQGKLRTKLESVIKNAVFS
jgi:hypothetical protein